MELVLSSRSSEMARNEGESRASWRSTLRSGFNIGGGFTFLVGSNDSHISCGVSSFGKEDSRRGSIKAFRALASRDAGDFQRGRRRSGYRD